MLSALLLSISLTGCSTSQRGSAPPPSPAGISNDPALVTALEKSCFQCHSTGGTAPWYAAMSPTYLAAGSARGVLNFSEWSTYDAGKKAAEKGAIADAVNNGSMPPGDYTMLDHSARLSEEAKQTLLKWAAQPAH